MDPGSDVTEYSSLDKDALLKLILIRDSEIAQLSQQLEKANAEKEKILEKVSKLYPGVGQDVINQNNADLLSVSVAVQVPENSMHTDCGEKPMPTWTETDNSHSASIADILRETAEGEIKSQEKTEDEFHLEENANETNSEYIFDSNSGYYYHPATGYYWDPNSRLFFDYTSGVYYQFNEGTGSYEVYSSLSCHENSSASPSNTRHVKLASKPRERKKREELSKSRDNKLKRRVKKSRSKGINHEKRKLKLTLSQEIEGKDKQDIAKDDEHMEVDSNESDSSDSLASGESELVSEVESGELISSDDDSEILESKDDDLLYQSCDNPDEYEFSEAMAAEYPPCIRFIVQESESLPVGALYIVTCAGGTIGREQSSGHALLIPDTSVSKSHAEIFYDFDGCLYNIKDLGSCNGTMINGKRLSRSKKESHSHPLSHEDDLQIGNDTKLLVHIHKGYETCEECEPGQVQAKLKSLSDIKNDIQVLSKEEKKIKQKQELKRIKKKFGLQNSYFESPGATVKKAGYEDKALARRKLVGSENGNEKMESASSVHSPIAASNKGHKLLAKMGWKEGEGLGKSSTGIAEPINVEMRLNQNAGLGSDESASLSMDNLQQASKVKRWTQARQRFNKLENYNNQHKNTLSEIPSTQALNSTNAQNENNASHKKIVSQAYPKTATTTVPSEKNTSKHSSKMKWMKGDTQIS